tara:strand:+ start:431 stop:667 length:237 start_codon:yes stop_codon:yes gene_type:complete
VSSCKKCSRGPLSVHILSSGFCQECQGELEWKNGDREHARQKAVGSRVAYYKKAEKFINRKWKEKYGDASPEEVASYQ